jgi:hypothetical protein
MNPGPDIFCRLIWGPLNDFDTYYRKITDPVLEKFREVTAHIQPGDDSCDQIVSFLCTIWNTLNSEEKNSWILPSKRKRLSPFNIFISFNVNNIIRGGTYSPFFY